MSRLNSVRARNRVRILAAGVLGLCLAGYWAYVHLVERTPFYSTSYDPEMAYVLNSLSIFKSQPYAYFDHPGTPVELLGTILLALMRPVIGLGSQSYWVYLIDHPEQFLTLAHAVLTVGSIITLLLLALLAVDAENWIDVLVSAAIPASYFAVLPSAAFDSLTLWSHNSFNFLAGTLLLLFLYRRLRSGNPLRLPDILVYGGLAGVITAIQLYLATWVVGISLACIAFEILQGRSALRALAAGIGIGLSSLLGFFIATLPILHKYREFSWWVRGLVFHQGRYGHGAAGITSLKQITQNLASLWQSGSLLILSSLLVLLIVGFSAYLKRNELRREAGWWATAVGLTLQMLLTLAVIAKHPATIYLLAPAAILPILLAVALGTLAREDQWGKRISLAVSCVVLLGFFIGLRAAFQQQARRVATLNSESLETSRVIDGAARSSGRDPRSLLILWSYGTESRCYALRFGNRYAGGVFDDEIDAACPLDWTYEASADSVELPGGYSTLADSTRWDVLVIPKSDLPEDPQEYGDVIIPGTGHIAYIVAERSKE